MIKVSVIVPVYNVEKYLNKCLDSLLCQSLNDVEIVLVEDGGTDKSLEIAREYAEKHQNVKLIIHETNKGIGKTRNDGIGVAEGEYLTFVDSDDYVSSDYCEKFYEFAKENKLDFVSASTYLDHDGVITEYDAESFEISDMEHDPDILVKMTYGPCNKMFRTSIIKGNDIRFEEKLKYEDLPFVAKALKNSRFGFLDGYYYYYVIHGGSQTTTLTKKNYDIYQILNIVNEYYEYKPYAELEAMNIKNVIWHILLQREQPDDSIRNEHIDKGYGFLDIHFPQWRNNKYYKQESIKTRFVKNHKLLMMLYCWYWRKKHA